MLITTDPREKARAFCSERKLQLPMLSDAAGSLARPFNVVFTPRAYLLDSGGRLLFVQPYGQAAESAVQAVTTLRGVGDPSGAR